MQTKGRGSQFVPKLGVVKGTGLGLVVRMIMSLVLSLTPIVSLCLAPSARLGPQI